MQALIVSARDAARNLDTTLTTTNGTIKRLDQNLVQQLPGILEKLDATWSSWIRPPVTPTTSLARTARPSIVLPMTAWASWAPRSPSCAA